MKTVHGREARPVKVLEVTVLEGAGTAEDLCRLVRYYYDTETGDLLAVHDPCHALVMEMGRARRREQEGA